jgi:hypothetical protein
MEKYNAEATKVINAAQASERRQRGDLSFR